MKVSLISAYVAMAVCKILGKEIQKYLLEKILKRKTAKNGIKIMFLFSYKYISI